MSELLTMLNPKPADWSGMPAGGIPNITPEMVAAACRMLTRHVYLYALYKFAGQGEVVPELGYQNRIAVRHRAAMERWQVQPQHDHQVDAFADAVLFEALTPNLCMACKGAKVNQKREKCLTCKGSGAGEPWSGRERAKLMGITHTAFGKTWGERYSDMFHEFGYFDDLIDKQIRNQLFGG